MPSTYLSLRVADPRFAALILHFKLKRRQHFKPRTELKKSLRNRTKTVTIGARSVLAADRNNPICFQAPQKCVVNFKMAVALMGHVINKLRFLSDFKANIMQEKDQKSFFGLYSGSKEIDFLGKFGIGPVILKKVLCIVSLH